MKFLPGATIARGSGSIGGITWSHNRFGPYIRNKSIPVNPNTSRQQAARAYFAAAAEFWSGTLTPTQRLAWDQYAAAIPWTDVLGVSIYLTGYNMFLRTMALTLGSGLADVADGPTILTLPEVDPTFSVSASEATQLLSVVFDVNLAWVDEDEAAMLVTMGEPKGIGRNYLGGPYRFAGPFLGDSITPLTSPQTVTAPFLFAAGQKFDVSARIIRDDGRVCNPFWDSVIAAA